MIDVHEILSPDAYERIRPATVRALSRHKSARRVDLGHYLCLLFETRQTVLGQIQEIVRVEGRTSPTQIQREIDEYSCLLPSASLLTATLTVQAGPESVGCAIAEELKFDRGPITIEIGDRRSSCYLLRRHDMAPDAVHYIGFTVDQEFRAALCSSAPARLRLRSAIDVHDLALHHPLRAALLETLT